MDLIAEPTEHDEGDAMKAHFMQAIGEVMEMVQSNIDPATADVHEVVHMIISEL
jgi:hypothetical protein